MEKPKVVVVDFQAAQTGASGGGEMPARAVGQGR